MRTLSILVMLVQLSPVAPKPTVPKFADRKLNLPYSRTPEMASSYRRFRFI